MGVRTVRKSAWHTPRAGFGVGVVGDGMRTQGCCIALRFGFGVGVGAVLVMASVPVFSIGVIC